MKNQTNIQEHTDHSPDGISHVLELLASVLLLYDIRWPEAQDLFRRSYVEAVGYSLARMGKNQSQREIYRVGGITPRVYRAISDKSTHRFVGENNLSLSKIIHKWRFHPPYGQKGSPNPLVIKSDTGKDFRSLCSETIPGFSYKAILDDLLARKTISLSNGILKLNRRMDLSSKVDISQLTHICQTLEVKLSAIFHNLTQDDPLDGLETIKSLERLYVNVEDIDEMPALFKDIKSIIETAWSEAARLIDDADAKSIPKNTNPEQRIWVDCTVHVEPPVFQESLL